MVLKDSEAQDARAAESWPGDGFRHALGIALWVSVPVIVVVAYFLLILDGMSVAGCDGDCDLDLIDAAFGAYPWAVGGSIALAVVLDVVLRRTGRPTYWAAIAAVSLVICSAAVTSILFHIGFAPMDERNARIERGEFAEPELTEPVGTWRATGDGTPFLRFSSSGTLAGFDGCNDLTGLWTQDPNGLIAFDQLLTVTTNDCGGVDTWLSKAKSARAFEVLLYINGPDGSPIGLLEASH